MSITILGIESSCDDTSAAIIRDEVMLSNVIASQAVHEAYGGVVPELASRAHQQNITARLLCSMMPWMIIPCRKSTKRHFCKQKAGATTTRFIPWKAAAGKQA